MSATRQTPESSTGAMQQACTHASQWVRDYPMHALAVAFLKGLVLGIWLRR